jgi:hypothetical protein
VKEPGAAAGRDAPSLSVRVFLAFLVARGAFGLYFLSSTLRQSPLPWYHPLGRRWTFESQPSGFAMGWFGQTALSLGCAVVFGGLTWLVTSRGALASWLSRAPVVLGIARAGGLILLVDFAYFGWALMHQTPAPLPLPAWYCPR